GDAKIAGAWFGSWNKEGVILFGRLGTPSLYRVSAAGGQPAPLAELDPSEEHRYPNFLPDGRHYFFLAVIGGNFTAYIGRLDSKERRPLPGIVSEVKYSPSGQVL